MRCQKVLWKISKMPFFAVYGQHFSLLFTGKIYTGEKVCSDIQMHGVGPKKEGKRGRREQVLHQQLPGGQLGGPRHRVQTPPCLEQVSTPLRPGISASLTMCGDCPIGEVAPWTSLGDQCPCGHQPLEQKSTSHGWEGKR